MSDTTDTIAAHYKGEKGPLFNLAMITAFLTTITLGVYRFWAKTRIRRYIWSSTSIGGDAFEYTGTGLEKFLGFLVAVVILAIYLGLIQMGLFYFGLNLFIEPSTAAQALAQMAAFYITFIAALPLIFFAQYRAYRYKLARTRWRGVRFGAEAAAWGYALRALGHLLLTILTLGLLLPRQTFFLEKYRTDRSWYGTARFEQDGRWQEMYGAMKHLLIGAAILIGGSLVAALSQSFGLGLVAAVVGYIWLIVGFVSYRVRAFEFLADHKLLDGEIGFRASLQTSTVVTHVLLGGFLVGLVTGILLAIIGWIATMLVGPAIASGGSGLAGIIVSALLYIAALMIAGALTLIWITQPILSHVISSITVRNATALDMIRQRAGDQGADAEGFADALDVGGAI